MSTTQRVIPRRVDTILPSDLIRLTRGGNEITISWMDAAGQIVTEVSEARAQIVSNFQQQQASLADAIALIQSQQTTMTALQSSLNARISEITTLQTAMATRIAEIAALQADMNTRSRVIEMGNITLSQTATVAISAGVRTLTFTVQGLQANDRTLLFPSSAMPTGYIIVAVVATASNTLQVTLQAPLLAIGASYSITCRVVVIR